MTCVRVCFVVTGACYTAYSGRHFHLVVPLTQQDGSATTVDNVEQQVRNQWPEGLKEMSESIKSVGLKLLKTGKLLSDVDEFSSVLTQTEIRNSEANEDETRSVGSDDSTSEILIHLVVQRCSPTPTDQKAKKTSTPEKARGGFSAGAQNDSGASPDQSAGNTNAYGRNNTVKDDSCCAVM